VVQDVGMPVESLNVQKVSREGLYEQVVQQVQELIVAKHLRTGDRLPPERELCEQFGVSRTVIREATKVLAQRGMLIIEPGRGTFVTLPTEENIALSIELFARARGLDYARVVEVRRALETEIAALAAQRAKPEHLDHLQRCIEEMDRNLTNPSAYVIADQEFHSTLAEATGNDLFTAISGVIVNLAQSARKLMFGVAGAPGRGQEYHRLILKYVAERDSDRARAAMLEHLQQVEQDIAAAQEGKEVQQRESIAPTS